VATFRQRWLAAIACVIAKALGFAWTQAGSWPVIVLLPALSSFLTCALVCLWFTVVTHPWAVAQHGFRTKNFHQDT
jgi:hypothetical protein